ncbi:hypothetical protein FFF34_001575 [Inquilinus sp. KBS0705]|nr:hypothetical protein FFF34_001575 [Inquilinus sp. KBS0705]
MEILIAHPVTQEQSDALKAIMKALKVDFEVEDMAFPDSVIAGVKESLQQAKDNNVMPYSGIKAMMDS